MIARLTVPADEFAGTVFWARVEQVAARHGHDEHPLILVGGTNPTNVYTLRCVRCDATVADITATR